MKVLVIYAHPSSKSFNHALVESFIEGLKKAKHEYEVIDLYKERFNPVLNDVESHGDSVTGLSDDVAAYQQKIKSADCLAFVFPTYWFRGPAILEGFIDRIFSAGFAFKYIKSMPKGLFPDKKAVVIQTYGGPGFYYQLLMHRIPWRRFKSVLTFCGIKKIIYQPCYNVPFTTDDVRKKYLEKVNKIGMNLN